MKDYYIASFSGGKDSTAMVLRLIEERKPLDEVINIDTSVEFPAMYEHIAEIRRFVQIHGIKFTTIKAEHDFEYYLLEHPVKPRNPKYKPHKGYGFPMVVGRWCTRRLKTEPVEKYLKTFKDVNVIEYIGFASDEPKRIIIRPDRAYPLVDWGMTEKDCLEYCFDRGYDFGGLYEHMDRVSCWCCPLSSLKSLKVLWKYYPELWAKLENWEKMIGERDVKFTRRYSVAELTERFKKEDVL